MLFHHLKQRCSDSLGMFLFDQLPASSSYSSCAFLALNVSFTARGLHVDTERIASRLVGTDATSGTATMPWPPGRPVLAADDVGQDPARSLFAVQSRSARAASTDPSDSSLIRLRATAFWTAFSVTPRCLA